jgi:hypothetical protein
VPGDKVKDWEHYDLLRSQGHSKQQAAILTNRKVKRRNRALKGWETRRAKQG